MDMAKNVMVLCGCPKFRKHWHGGNQDSMSSGTSECRTWGTRSYTAQRGWHAGQRAWRLPWKETHRTTWGAATDWLTGRYFQKPKASGEEA